MEAIIGVAIGWVLAVARELFTWIWRRHESAREAREVVRREARLVSADLLAAERQLLGIIEGRVIWREMSFPIVRWEHAREILVNAVSPAEWEALGVAYSELDEINGMTANRSDVDAPRLAAAAKSASPRLRRAIEALSRLSA